jgi:endoglycosylceramidase
VSVDGHADALFFRLALRGCVLDLKLFAMALLIAARGSLRRSVLRFLLLTTAVLALSVESAQALPLLSHDGRWLTDPQGRVVILHGVQIDKFKPGTAVQGWIDVSPLAVPFIASQGFNLARVDIDFTGVEPQLGQFDDSYIQQFAAFDNQLAAAGIYHLVNMMQGQYAAEFDGSGFPSWMVITNGVPNQPGPFPQSYLYDPAEERAWDNFWANTPASDGVGLQDHFGHGLQHLAHDFAGLPAFLGFDLLNEPWSGSQWPSCANPNGCPVFDQELTDFYRRIIPELRADDPHHLVFYEPHALFDQGANTHLGRVNDPNAVFTFHNYCLGDQPGLPQADPGQDCGVEEQMVLGYADARASQTGDGLLEDEWGNTASVPLLQRMTAEADQHMIGWSYWAYEDCCNSPGAIVYDATKDPMAPDNLNMPVLQALVRPYPQLISGTPISWSFDPQSKAFSLNYSTKRVAGGVFAAGSPTAVFVPRLQYPEGYTVTVSGADIASDPTSGRLVLCSRADASAVSVTLKPDTSSTTSLPPGPDQAVTCPPATGGGGGGGTTVTPGPHVIVTVAHGGGLVKVAGVGTIRLPNSARCLAARTMQLWLGLARRAHLVSVSVSINGRRRAVQRRPRDHFTIPVDGPNRGRFNLRLVVRIATPAGTHVIYINRHYAACAPDQQSKAPAPSPPRSG